ncbi:hypothetical protein pb186bvf_017242 [Paramecium bursaria]
MNNRPNPNRYLLPTTIGQVRREQVTMADKKHNRDQFCNSKRQTHLTKLRQQHQAQPTNTIPTPPPPKSKVFQTKSSSVHQTPSRDQQVIVKQSASHPSSLKKQQEDPVKIQDDQFDSISVVQQEQYVQYQNFVQDAPRDQNLLQHQSQQFENSSQIRQDEQGLQGTSSQRSNHYINVPPHQEYEVEYLNSQSQVQNNSQNVRILQYTKVSPQQNQEAWVKNQNGEKILYESELKNPNLVYSQESSQQLVPQDQGGQNGQVAPMETVNQFQLQGRYEQSESKSVQQTPQRNRSPTGFSTSQSEKNYQSEWKIMPSDLKFHMFPKQPIQTTDELELPPISSSSSSQEQDKDDGIFGNLMERFRNLFR